jgi:hypothetical protein
MYNTSTILIRTKVQYNLRVLRVSGRLSCCCRGLGCWRRVYTQVDADDSEKHAVSIPRD